eukprot:10860758-Alexandrium_andersonii.AAC.2
MSAPSISLCPVALVVAVIWELTGCASLQTPPQHPHHAVQAAPMATAALAQLTFAQRCYQRAVVADDVHDVDG